MKLSLLFGSALLFATALAEKNCKCQDGSGTGLQNNGATSTCCVLNDGKGSGSLKYHDNQAHQSIRVLHAVFALTPPSLLAPPGPASTVVTVPKECPFPMNAKVSNPISSDGGYAVNTMPALVIAYRKTSSQPLQAIIDPATQKYANEASFPANATIRPIASGAVQTI
ncbi:hypothetical protein V499_00180 [Pseudogymnoascus sp. VKM F-103]|nr:hypothetical protein V499_00180 [Pseudogymnoascus sp. VKM F-103]